MECHNSRTDPFTNPWVLLRGTEAEQEEGIRLVRHDYVERATVSRTMELGVALLWVGQYVLAFDHFRNAIKGRGPKIDSYYGMAGVAKWCLGDQREAIAEWVSGLKAGYTDAAGGVQMPLLLFFASVINPNVYDNATVIKLMLPKTADERIHYWPGPIVQLILGQIKGGEFLRQCQGRHERDLRDNLWHAEFYRSLMRFEPSKILDFRESMHKLTDIEQPEWQDEDLLLTRIWKEEFFLARYEAGNI